MRREPIVAGLAVMALGAGSAAAAAQNDTPPALQKAFTGAITATYSDGRHGSLWPAADGTFKAQGRSGFRLSGRWNRSGDRVCFRQQRPIWIPFRWCTALPATLDQPWPGHAPAGEAVTFAFVPGDRPPAP